MPRWIRGLSLALAAALAAPGLQAQESPGTPAGGVTAAEVEDVDVGPLRDEALGIRPQLGAVIFEDVLGNDTSRAVYGLTIDWNLVATFSDHPRARSFYAGPTTGLIFSHLGAPGSNFLGADADVDFGRGANLLLVPLNARFAYNFSANFRMGAHGGANLVYRSERNAIALGKDAVGLEEAWDFFPNVGVDVEVGIGRNAALMLRPDLTITSEENLIVGTLALVLPIG
jgi:hypothetical protein